MSSLKRKIYLALRSLRHGATYTVHGVNVQVPASVDPEIRYLLARGRPYEMEEASLIDRYLPAGINVVELGGSIGVISALIRRKIGPDAHHLIVEAVPHLAAVCEANAKQGTQAENVQVIRKAVDYSGADTVTFDTGHNAHTGRVTETGPGLKVPTTTLARLATDMPEGEFALVCDIEGAETALFENESEVLDRVPVIILETHPDLYHQAGSSPAVLESRLQALGYKTAEAQGDVICLLRDTG